MNQNNRSMHATLSDDEDDSQTHDESCLALVASYTLHDSTSVSNKEENNESSSSHESNNASNEETEELDLQTAYDQMCDELIKTEKRNIKLNNKLQIFDEKMNIFQKCEDLIKNLNAEKDALLVKMSECQLSRQSLLNENEKLKDNITTLGNDNESLKLKVTQLEREHDKAKFVKVDLENRSEKLAQILADPIRFSNDKSGLGFDRFAPSTSYSKKEPTFVKSDTEKNFVNGKPIKQIQAIKIPKKVSQSQKEVLEVVPFEAYKHTLPQPFWCEVCNRKGHLSEFCWQVKKKLPKAIPTRPKPNARSISFDNRVKVLLSESTRIFNELKALGINDDSRFRHSRGYGKIRTPRVAKVWVPKGTVAPT